MAQNAVAVIAGSAFGANPPEGLVMTPVTIDTPWGGVNLHEVQGMGRPAYLRFRHDLPHNLLPHQIPFRAQAWAFKEVGCEALLVTSSVGVLDADVPIFEPLIIQDLIMLDNRLPNGSTCTMFETPSHDQGHLVVNDGLFSSALNEQLGRMCQQAGTESPSAVTFAYVAGPRTKTKAENALWARLGAQVNSMTLAPEIVLANELEIPCAGLAVGHKYSVPTMLEPDESTVAASLVSSRKAMETIVLTFLREAEAVPFGNHIFRFGTSDL